MNTTATSVMRREQYNFAEKTWIPNNVVRYHHIESHRQDDLVKGVGRAQSKALVGYSGSEMQREICKNEGRLSCSPLAALLRIAIRFASQHPRTRASRTEHPFAAHAHGRMRSAATPLDCSQVGAGMPPRAILLSPCPGVAGLFGEITGSAERLVLWDKELLLCHSLHRHDDTEVCAPSNAHGITANKEHSWSSMRAELVVFEAGHYNNRNLMSGDSKSFRITEDDKARASNEEDLEDAA
ncbi:hypothetical protein C8J56DRAFT_905131 [Mycena floridula]|nr:hypothetical protein C8J56DRAFT_905131 [Mycena floridula]